MHIRAFVFAAALPLLAATACKTSNAEKGTSSQAQASEVRHNSQDEGQTPTQARSGSETATGNDRSSTAISGGDQGSEQGTSPGTGSGSMSSGSTASSEHGMRAHSDDRIVRGRVTKVSEKSVEIQSAQGEAKTLQLVPQTSVKIDGQDAQQSDLEEGQEVRASFNSVEGKDVAVEIRAGHQMGSGSSDSMHQGTGSSDTGSSSGSSGSSDTGSSGKGH